jgi:hypothetical protein
MLTEQAAIQLSFVQRQRSWLTYMCEYTGSSKPSQRDRVRSSHPLRAPTPADGDTLRFEQTPSDMYKVPALREDRRLLRDHRRVPEDARAFDATTGSNALRGNRQRCQTHLVSNGTARYQYRRLDRSRQEIRLLTLEPGSGTDTIRCTLKHEFLDVTSPPLYETISYFCGDPANRRAILLHGHGVLAMATSEAALRRMRLQDRPRTLWIDSICINQNDTNEKGHQVGMMCQIYAKTFGNLVWLGPCNLTIAESINAMEAILQEIAVETRDYADFKELLFDENHKLLYSKKPLSGNVDYLAFLRILDNPWFSRLWIVQEVSLAPTSMCHCGDFEVSFTNILRSAMWLNHKWSQMPKISTSTAEHLSHAVSIIDAADKTYGRFHIRGLSSVMLNLLSKFGYMRTFDRRDRVFAILGLWQTFTETTMLPSVLEPDYNLSVDEVFKIYIRYAIEESAGLYPLEWISEPSREVRDASWPSWLPAIDRDPFDLKNEPDGMLRSVFCVDNSEPMILKKESSRPNDLIVSGVLLDSITEVSATFTPSTTSSEMLTLMADLECPCCESWAGTTVADLETQVSLVLLGGISRRARVSHQEALQGYQSFKAYLKEHGSFPGMRWVPSSASNEDKVASKHGAGMANALTFRVAFHTTTGFIGIGPRCTEPGDVVAILYGSRLPIVLRPVPELSKGSYRLLGVSYVYGIMDGEAVRRHKEMGLEDDVFRIV